MKNLNLNIRLVIVAAVTCLFASCASVGNNFDEGKVSSIKKGETTEAELIQMFGQQSRGVTSEGKTTLTWMYVESRVKGESFIPYAGPFVGGSRSQTKTLSVALLEGKVESFSCTGGGMESRGTTQDVPKK